MHHHFTFTLSWALKQVLSHYLYLYYAILTGFMARDLFGLVFKQLDWHPYVYFKLRLVYFTGSSFPDTWKVILHLFLTLFVPIILLQKVFLKFCHILLLYNVGLVLASGCCTKCLPETVLQPKLFYNSMELSNS